MLFVVRPDLELHRGGDTTQILSTARELTNLGVRVEVSDQLPASLDDVDLVHLFHLDRLWENVPHLTALAGRRPFVLSPIWWPKDDYNAHSRRGLQGRVARVVGTRRFDALRLVVRSFVAFGSGPSRDTLPRPSAWRFQRRSQELLATAAMVLPNSVAEARRLESHFATTFPYAVLPNGTDPVGTLADSCGGGGGPGIDVLCVARLEPRKNQHKIIEALRDTDLRVAFAGTSGQFSSDYEAECRGAATARMTFLGPVPRDDLPELYRSARVHVLPSWFETPGLSSLEAASHGCPIVVGECEPVREYFGDLATYCDPGSVDSIRAAILSTVGRPRNDELARHVAERYSWAAAARATLAAYERALA